MTTTIWTLLFIFVIAPLGALAFDRSLFGNWIWHIAGHRPARQRVSSRFHARRRRTFRAEPATRGGIARPQHLGGLAGEQV
jgi:hypothetical protein